MLNHEFWVASFAAGSIARFKATLSGKPKKTPYSHVIVGAQPNFLIQNPSDRHAALVTVLESPNCESIWNVPVSNGGAPTLFFRKAGNIELGMARGIASTAEYIFVADNRNGKKGANGLVRISFDGKSAKRFPISETEGDVVPVISDGTQIYFGTDTSIYRMADADAAPEKLDLSQGRIWRAMAIRGRTLFLVAWEDPQTTKPKLYTYDLKTNTQSKPVALSKSYIGIHAAKEFLVLTSAYDPDLKTGLGSIVRYRNGKEKLIAMGTSAEFTSAPTGIVSVAL